MEAPGLELRFYNIFSVLFTSLRWDSWEPWCSGYPKKFMHKMNVRIKFWTNFPKQKNLPVCDATSMWMLPREGRPLWVSSFSGKAHKIEFTPKLPGVVNPGLGELGVGRLVLIGALKEKLCHPAYSIFFFFFQIENPFCMSILIEEPCSFNTLSRYWVVFWNH